MSTSLLATDNQLSFIRDLVSSRAIPADELVGIEYCLSKSLDRTEASNLIDRLKSYPYAPREPRTATPTSDLTEGIYFKSDEVYKVKRSSAGRMYALRLVGASWSYDPSHVKGLTLADKITPEQASAFGIRTGVCAICGIPLTNLDSLERGIGPICAKRDW